MNRVEIYSSRRGLQRRKQWRWRFVAPNGRKIANSGEGYHNMSELLSSLELVLGVPGISPQFETFGAKARSTSVTRGDGTSVQVVVLKSEDR